MSASCVTTAFLPPFRVKMSDHFAITGVDFAGPVHYKVIYLVCTGFLPPHKNSFFFAVFHETRGGIKDKTS